MDFYIDSLTRIQDKVYVYVKSLFSDTEFQLSDTSFLGPAAIENWIDIPRSIEQDSDQLYTNNFVFVLKNESDIQKLNVGSKYPLYDRNTKVLESGLTVSGRIFVILQCNAGVIEVGSKLIASNGDVWTIIENNITIGKVSESRLQEKIKDDRMYMYKLEESSGALIYPRPGSILQVELKDFS